jgi:hypothetical protein
MGEQERLNMRVLAPEETTGVLALLIRENKSYQLVNFTIAD